MDLDDDKFIYLSYDKYKDHPSVQNIAENHQLPSNFEFKEVSPDHVQSTLSKLNPQYMIKFPKVLKIVAPVIANSIASIINNSIRTANSHQTVSMLR